MYEPRLFRLINRLKSLAVHRNLNSIYVQFKNVIYSKLKCDLKPFWLTKSMTTNLNLLKPPEDVINMKVLNRSLFKKVIEVPFVDVSHVKVSSVLPKLKKYIFKMERKKPVITEGDKTSILLNPLLICAWTDLDKDVRDYLHKRNVVKAHFDKRTDELQYENFSLEDVFRSVLPKELEGMASFTKVGHIVHVNLREHLLPFKTLIGEVLFDKVAGCRTVVNKTDMIDNTYRNFQMEILCGENDFQVTLKENKCTFEFDFSKVYWNSRLCTEHERIINFIKPNEVLFDVFAGVGPFSIPIAKKNATVYANDLNPESFKWLEHNAKINKIGTNLKAFNKCGREFILNEIKENLPKHVDKKVHIVMNLPALAVEFLPAFCDLYKENELEIKIPPTIYVYCFTKGENFNKLAKELVIKSFGFDMGDKIMNIFRVRTVSSMKEMMRVSIQLDEDILMKCTAKRKLDIHIDESNKRCA